MAPDRGPALALLPAVAVGRGGRVLQLAVVALVAHPGALSAAAQRVGQAAGAALENVLSLKVRSLPPHCDLLSHLQSRSFLCFFAHHQGCFQQCASRSDRRSVAEGP